MIRIIRCYFFLIADSAMLGKRVIKCGEVAHQSPPLGFGLRFVTLSDEQREKLHSVLDHLQPIS